MTTTEGTDPTDEEVDPSPPRPAISHDPLWPDYFARLGQPDAASWQ